MTLPTIRLHDTASRALRDFTPKTPGKASVYCCGPTVYDVAHVGHARSAVAFDMLVRVLTRFGCEVQYVRNVTDVDDKILARAKEAGETPTTLSERMADAYRTDLKALNCIAPSIEPLVSTHIPQIIAIIEKLIAGGSAYAVSGESGIGSDVYFRVRSFPTYGKLSGRNVDEMRSGARVEVDERKEDPIDFALWKGCDPSSWGWESPWGRGRPGWHIECSAMCAEHLGHGFDIHAGGMDLIFPHHENEIAQSESAYPGEGPFARYWLHNGFVNVDREKMSKSLGNFVTVRDVLARNDAEALRLYLLLHHYRGPVAFDVEKLESSRVLFPGIDEAERKIDYLYALRARFELLDKQQVEQAQPGGKLPKTYADARVAVVAAHGEAIASLADDLASAGAVTALYRIAAIANEMLDLHQRKKAERSHTLVVIREAQRTFDDLCATLGLLAASVSDYQARTRSQRLGKLGLAVEDVQTQVAARLQARQDKDFAQADAIRASLEAQGIELQDGDAGATTFRVRV